MINGLAWQKVLVSTPIEKDQRLSRSILWRLQSAFYRQSGVAAWNRGFVPHYITNNPYIAGTYARVTQAFLRDRPPLDTDQPVYILELGAGSGRFAYHFLQRFLPLVAESGTRVVYLLTDLAESNVDFWRQHPRLQPYLQSGQLDLACFDPLRDHEIHLAVSGKTLSAADFTNPPVVLANYFFDSLPADLFSVHNGLLCEELVTLVAPGPQPDVLDPAIVPSLEIRFRPRLTTPQYYFDAELDRLLQGYLSLDGSYLLFPLAALECLRSLLQLANERMLVLSADKGAYRLEDIRSLQEPAISLHGSGGISMQVNFHALAGYLDQRGGRALYAKNREDGLVIAALLAGGSPSGDRETCLAFRESMENSNPDDFFMLKKAFEPHYAGASLEQLLAFLRLSGDDPQIFSGMASYLLDRAASAGAQQQERLYEAACRVWNMFYPIGEAFDLHLALARLFIALARYPEALECLRSSQHFYGPSAETDGLIEQCRKYVWEETVDGG